MRDGRFNMFVAGWCAFAAIVAAIAGSFWLPLINIALCAVNLWAAGLLRTHASKAQ